MPLHNEKGPVEGAPSAQTEGEDPTLDQDQQEGAEWYEGEEGAGQDQITGDMAGQAYLSMIQPNSAASGEGDEHTGKWRNSATGDVLTDTVEVIPLQVSPVWSERASESPYNTVGRYEVGSIPVDIQQPKPGTRGFPKMTNPKTGNKVEELFIYAVMIKDDPEHVLFFSPTATSMRVCKQWNSQIRSQRLPNGKLAPFHGYSWFLTLKMEPNPARPKEMLVSLGKVARGSLLTRELAVDYVKPQLAVAGNLNLLAIAAPEESTQPAE